MNYSFSIFRHIQLAKPNHNWFLLVFLAFGLFRLTLLH